MFIRKILKNNILFGCHSFAKIVKVSPNSGWPSYLAHVRRQFSDENDKDSSNCGCTSKGEGNDKNDGSTGVEHTYLRPPPSIPYSVFRFFEDSNEQLGPGADMCGAYRNPEYYGYHRYSYVDLLVETLKIQAPPPPASPSPAPPSPAGVEENKVEEKKVEEACAAPENAEKTEMDETKQKNKKLHQKSKGKRKKKGRKCSENTEKNNKPGDDKKPGEE